MLQYFSGQEPHLLVENDNSNGVGRAYPKTLIRNKGL